MLKIGEQVSATQAAVRHVQTEKELKFFLDCDLLSRTDRIGSEGEEVCALALVSNASHEPRSLSCLVLRRGLGETSWCRIGALVSFRTGTRQVELPLKSLFLDYGADAIVELE